MRSTSTAGRYKAGSIAIGSGASFLASGNSSYTGASALNETITDNGSFALANFAHRDRLGKF